MTNRRIIPVIIGALLLGVALALPATARTWRPEEVPNVQLRDARRYVSNPDGILPREAVVRLDSICGSLRDRGLAQVAVVAVDDIAGGDPFSFAIELFRQWGVGSARSNNGLGILLVKDLREIRFVTGGGLEGILPDALCKRIQVQRMLPFFREGDYGAGMVAGVEAAAAVLEGGEPDLSGDGTDDLPWWAVLALVGSVFVVVPLLLWLANRYGRHRCPNCGRRTLKQVAQRTLDITPEYRLEECEYLCPHCGKRFRRRFRSYRNDRFGGRGGGMIIGGGGFGGLGGGSFGGGFGGGSFGGGGAGSRW